MSQKVQSTVVSLFLCCNTVTFCVTPMPPPWTLPPYHDIFYIWRCIATPSHPCKFTRCPCNATLPNLPIHVLIFYQNLCLIIVFLFDFQEEPWRFMERALNQRLPTKRCFCPRPIMSATSSERRWISTGWISPSVIRRTIAWFRYGIPGQ